MLVSQKKIYTITLHRIEIKDGDAEAALAYLCGKAEIDSFFFFF